MYVKLLHFLGYHFCVVMLFCHSQLLSYSNIVREMSRQQTGCQLNVLSAKSPVTASDSGEVLCLVAGVYNYVTT